MKIKTIAITAMIVSATPPALAAEMAFAEARQEALTCSNLAGAEYAKTSPNETVDRLAEAAAAKCDCLAVRTAELFLKMDKDYPPAMTTERLKHPNAEAVLRAEIEGGRIGAMRAVREEMKRETVAYILDSRTGFKSGNWPNGAVVVTVEKLLSDCHSRRGQ